jgi:alpha,alpha-trehalase
VAPDGTVDWLCVPRFDSPSVFAALLDRGAGGFRFAPFGINVPSDRIYEPGTNTLLTSWRTSTGWVVVRDSLTIGPRRGEDTATPHTRPPVDDDADHALVRTAKCIAGSVEIDLVCEPAFDYGATPAEWTESADRHRADANGGEQALRLQTDMHPGIEGSRARARHVLRAGETVYCALAWSEQSLVPTSAEDAFEQLEATTAFWRDWLARAAIPDHDLAPLIQRSALTIKGLTYMPTGAAVAALTTSLPETPGGQRNWDYRYTWIRDSTLPAESPALSAARLGGRRVHAVHGRRRAQRRRRFADHVRDRRPA